MKRTFQVKFIYKIIILMANNFSTMCFYKGPDIFIIKRSEFGANQIYQIRIGAKKNRIGVNRLPTGGTQTFHRNDCIDNVKVRLNFLINIQNVRSKCLMRLLFIFLAHQTTH